MAGKRPPDSLTTEVRGRSVRPVFEQHDAHDTQWEAIRSIAKWNGCAPETMRLWVRRPSVMPAAAPADDV